MGDITKMIEVKKNKICWWTNFDLIDTKIKDIVNPEMVTINPDDKDNAIELMKA